MKNLYIDFDGVIMNTIEVVYSELEAQGVDCKNQANNYEISKFFGELDWNDLLENRASVINDGIKCIKKIIESKRFNVAILSHINSLNEAASKVEYIRKYFKDITFIPVPKAISKTKMVQTKDSILVDDYVGNLIEWKKEGGIGIKFSTKLNGKGFPVIDRLDQILDLLLIADEEN